MRFGVTVRVAERLCVNDLLGEYRIYKKGEWTTRKLPALKDDPPPTAKAGGDDAARPPLDERKRQLESMSKDDLVELVMQNDSGPRSKKRGGAPSGVASKRARGEGQKRPGDVDAAPSFNEDVLRRFLSMSGPELVDLMLTEGPEAKIFDNRTWTINELGWFMPLVALDKKWRDAKWTKSDAALHKKCKAIPVKDDLKDWYGHVPGALYFVETRRREQCNGNEWAFGPNCFLVSKFCKFKSPVPIKKRGGARPYWDSNEEERELIRAQLPNGPPSIRDLASLGFSDVAANAAESAPAAASQPGEKLEQVRDPSVKLRIGDVVDVLAEDGSPTEKGLVAERTNTELNTYLVECETSGLINVERRLLQLVRPFER